MILHGDALEMLRTLPDESVQCCVTSPPYWGLRDYGVEGQIGFERTPEEYVARLVAVFGEVRRVLRDDGTLWANLGDSYFGDSPARRTSAEAFSKTWDASQTRSRGGTRRSAARVGDLKPKDLVGIPWMVAFALRTDGWYLRSDIIWSKPNPMPESVTDRPTKSHEYVFLMSKSGRYHFDQWAIKEPSLGIPAPSWEQRKAMGEGPRRIFSQNAPQGCHRVGGGLSRNIRTVWSIATQPYSEAHFATFPEALVERCIAAGSRSGDTIIDPFFGSGTVGEVAERMGRKWIGIELNPEYVRLAEKRTAQAGLGI